MMRSEVIATTEALVPFVTYAELLTGVERARDPYHEDERMFNTIGINPVIYPDLETLAIYGKIGAQLQRSGLSVPTNDLWNAALALQHDLPLLAADAHFARVPGLSVVAVR